MSFRRNKKSVKRHARWKDFCRTHSECIHQIGLVDAIISDEGRFLDFLEHGYLDHHHDDLSSTTSWKFTHTQMMLFVTLIACYFVEFEEYFLPIALHHALYQKMLCERLEKPLPQYLQEELSGESTTELLSSLETQN